MRQESALGLFLVPLADDVDQLDPLADLAGLNIDDKNVSLPSLGRVALRKRDCKVVTVLTTPANSLPLPTSFPNLLVLMVIKLPRPSVHSP